MHILFAAGGTAGHVNPAIAVANTIKEYHPAAVISFIGNKNGIEETLCKKAGFNFYPIEAAGFKRKISFNNIKHNISAAYKMFNSSKQAEIILKSIKPDVVVGMGGYVSGPVLRKAYKMGIKTCIHESNAYPGVATKMLCSHVDEVMLGMEDAKKQLSNKRKYIFTGNPVRQEIVNTSKQNAKKDLSLDDRLLILSTGGSQGARSINNAVCELTEWNIKNKKDIIQFHAYGKFDNGVMEYKLKQKGINIKKTENLFISEYIYNMDKILAAADIVIARAGTGTLCEITAAGKPSILIPYPHAAENHQYYNAMTLVNAGAAVIIKDEELTGERLKTEIIKIIEDKEKMLLMGKKAKEMAVFDANNRIYNVIMKLYRERKA